MVTDTAAPKDLADREFNHPLKSIPLFRRLPDNEWVSIFLTAILSLFCGITFGTIGGLFYPQMGLREHISISLVYSFVIGYSIKPFGVRLVADVAVWVGGAMMGVGIAATALGHGTRRIDSTIISVLIGTVIMSVVTGIALRQRALEEINAEREKAERSEAQRTLALSRLRLLQAQIEPHFLFNTLANVSSLIESDPKQARKMLDQFTLLLRASLDQTRKDTTSLRSELQVIEAYLSVLKVRMGERLSYSIDADNDLLNLQVPTMLLQPIVENAVKHGIEPRVKGGSVKIEVKRDVAQLVLAVADDGVGFVSNTVENIGLGAVRERLDVQFGPAAALTTERTPENWTRVVIRIPMPE
jgi:two-component sensor histidine kinase